MVDVMEKLADGLGVKVPTQEEMNEPEKYSLYRQNQPRPRSRTFTAKPCTLCTALREPDTNFTRVYASRGNVRYCRCTYCNNTWKDSDG
jgi:hypothetical protein